MAAGSGPRPRPRPKRQTEAGDSNKGGRREGGEGRDVSLRLGAKRGLERRGQRSGGRTASIFVIDNPPARSEGL